MLGCGGDRRGCLRHAGRVPVGPATAVAPFLHFPAFECARRECWLGMLGDGYSIRQQCDPVMEGGSRWRTGWPTRRARICCSTRTTPSTGGSGGPRRSRRRGERNVPVLLSRRVRRLPLVPRDGARVVRGRGDRGVPQRALRERQGRPRGTSRRRRGLHAGDDRDDRPRRLADDLRARPRGRAVLRRHLLPRPAAARAARVPAGAPGARQAWTLPPRGGAAGRRPASATTCAAPSCPPGRSRSTRGARRRPLPHSPGSSTPPTAGSAPRPSSRRRWCSSSCSGTPAAGPAATRRRDARPHAGRDGPRRHLRPARRRLRALQVDRGWVVPHFEKMLYDNAQLVGVYARRGATTSAAGWRARPRTS